MYVQVEGELELKKDLGILDAARAAEIRDAELIVAKYLPRYLGPEGPPRKSAPPVSPPPESEVRRISSGSSPLINIIVRQTSSQDAKPRVELAFVCLLSYILCGNYGCP